ncbi:hypothetical protein NP493_17g03022 [Ridgeia piscesae]|uniref:Uncharacterized protein n=1 Tax=Ridgeia piscesae TaxID=27915 RepID=A0AAD9UKP0_RIDPI|nr:hypothetical protein NP493_17g03022 [Ridgeia piscesae]
MWLKISLDNLEVVKTSNLKTKRELVDLADLEEDFSILTKISELSSKLTCLHEELSGSVNDLLNSINRQLSEHQLKNPPPKANRVELLATTMERVAHITVVFPSPEKRAFWESAITEAKQKLVAVGMLTVCLQCSWERVAHITVVFPSPEKRAFWESAITEAKQKLEATVDGKDPEFLHALQITKTRAGMQFSCASPIDGLNLKQCRDVWVCNSDGYVGHMCLLSLQPEPIVTLNSPVPGCNSRILCICATPAFLKFKRKVSGPRGGSRQVAAPKITVEEDHDDDEDREEPEAGGWIRV